MSNRKINKMPSLPPKSEEELRAERLKEAKEYHFEAIDHLGKAFKSLVRISTIVKTLDDATEWNELSNVVKGLKDLVSSKHNNLIRSIVNEGGEDSASRRTNPNV